MVERVLQLVRGIGDELLITTNDPESYAWLGVRLVGDDSPGAGALSGLQTALRAARHERVLVVGCDMPFLSQPLLRYLAERAPEAEVVIPLRDGNYEPMVAVYARSCLPAIERSLAAGERRMISFLAQVELAPVEQSTLDSLDPDGLSFFNVNTPDDLNRAEQLLAEGAA